MMFATLIARSVGIVWQMCQVLKPLNKMEKISTEGEDSEMKFKTLKQATLTMFRK